MMARCQSVFSMTGQGPCPACFTPKLFSPPSFDTTCRVSLPSDHTKRRLNCSLFHLIILRSQFEPLPRTATSKLSRSGAPPAAAAGTILSILRGQELPSAHPSALSIAFNGLYVTPLKRMCCYPTYLYLFCARPNCVV